MPIELPGDLPPDIYFPLLATMNAASSLEWARTSIRARYNQAPSGMSKDQIVQRQAMIAIVEGFIRTEIATELNKAVYFFNLLTERAAPQQPEKTPNVPQELLDSVDKPQPETAAPESTA